MTYLHTQAVRCGERVSVLSVTLIVEGQPGLNLRIKMPSFQTMECITSLLLILHKFVCRSISNLSTEFGSPPLQSS